MTVFSRRIAAEAGCDDADKTLRTEPAMQHVLATKQQTLKKDSYWNCLDYIDPTYT